MPGPSTFPFFSEEGAGKSRTPSPAFSLGRRSASPATALNVGATPYYPHGPAGVTKGSNSLNWRDPSVHVNGGEEKSGEKKENNRRFGPKEKQKGRKSKSSSRRIKIMLVQGPKEEDQTSTASTAPTTKRLSTAESVLSPEQEALTVAAFKRWLKQPENAHLNQLRLGGFLLTQKEITDIFSRYKLPQSQDARRIRQLYREGGMARVIYHGFFLDAVQDPGILEAEETLRCLKITLLPMIQLFSSSRSVALEQAVKSTIHDICKMPLPPGWLARWQPRKMANWPVYTGGKYSACDARVVADLLKEADQQLASLQSQQGDVSSVPPPLTPCKARLFDLLQAEENVQQQQTSQVETGSTNTAALEM